MLEIGSTCPLLFQSSLRDYGYGYDGFPLLNTVKGEIWLFEGLGLGRWRGMMMMMISEGMNGWVKREVKSREVKCLTLEECLALNFNIWFFVKMVFSLQS